MRSYKIKNNTYGDNIVLQNFDRRSSEPQEIQFLVLDQYTSEASHVFGLYELSPHYEFLRQRLRTLC